MDLSTKSFSIIKHLYVFTCYPLIPVLVPPMIVDEVLEAPSLLSWFFFLSCRRRFITCLSINEMLRTRGYTTYQQFLHIKLVVPGLAPLSLALAVLVASDDFAWPEDSLRILASYIKGPWKARTFSLAKKRPSLIFLTCGSCSWSLALYGCPASLL